MNLIATTRCNRACAYCFAQTKTRDSGADGRGARTDVTIEEVETYLDFLAIGNIGEFKILGGEPTLHPELAKILDLGLARGLDVTVFTNGLWSRTVQDLLGDGRFTDVGFIFNVNEPAVTSGPEMARIHRSLEVAGPRATCGFNIYRPGFDLTFLGDLIEQHGLGRTIRLGLASPIAGADNAYVAPADMPEIGGRLVRQLEELARRDILGAFDCGFPLCMFTVEELGRLRLATRDSASVCKFPIDVGPGLKAWPCFPLSTVTTTDLVAYESPRKLLDAYGVALAPFRSFGMMDDCLACDYRLRDQCCGGCLAHTVRNLEDGDDPRLLEKMRSALSTANDSRPDRTGPE